MKGREENVDIRTWRRSGKGWETSQDVKERVARQHGNMSRGNKLSNFFYRFSNFDKGVAIATGFGTSMSPPPWLWTHPLLTTHPSTSDHPTTCVNLSRLLSLIVTFQYSTLVFSLWWLLFPLPVIMHITSETAWISRRGDVVYDWQTAVYWPLRMYHLMYVYVTHSQYQAVMLVLRL